MGCRAQAFFASTAPDEFIVNEYSLKFDKLHSSVPLFLIDTQTGMV